MNETTPAVIAVTYASTRQLLTIRYDGGLMPALGKDDIARIYPGPSLSDAEIGSLYEHCRQRCASLKMMPRESKTVPLPQNGDFSTLPAMTILQIINDMIEESKFGDKKRLRAVVEETMAAIGA